MSSITETLKSYTVFRGSFVECREEIVYNKFFPQAILCLSDGTNPDRICFLIRCHISHRQFFDLLAEASKSHVVLQVQLL